MEKITRPRAREKSQGAGGKNYISARAIAEVALFTALICVCACIALPTAVPATLQTLAIYLAVCVLGGKKAVICIICYLAIGSIGLPVFGAMAGGVGVIAGPSGGFLISFILLPVCAAVAGKFVRGERLALFLGLGVGTVLCYLAGAVQYSAVTGVSYASALAVCALPFLLVDAVKLTVGVLVGCRVKAAIARRTI
jgi:biotin transport system substrate-specific component